MLLERYEQLTFVYGIRYFQTTLWLSLNEPFRPHRLQQLITRFTLLLIMLSPIKLTYRLKVRHRNKLFHGVMLPSFLCQLNFLIVDRIDVLYRAMAFLETAEGLSCDGLGQGWRFLWVLVVMAMGFGEGGFGFKELEDLWGVLAPDRGVKIGVEIHAVTWKARLTWHYDLDIYFYSLSKLLINQPLIQTTQNTPLNQYIQPHTPPSQTLTTHIPITHQTNHILSFNPLKKLPIKIISP